MEANNIEAFDWGATTPDNWSLEKIVSDNVKEALIAFASEMRLVADFNTGELTIFLKGGDTFLDCGLLRDAFLLRLDDWRKCPQEADLALAWSDYLESLAAEIRAAVQQAQAPD